VHKSQYIGLGKNLLTQVRLYKTTMHWCPVEASHCCSWDFMSVSHHIWIAHD